MAPIIGKGSSSKSNICQSAIQEVFANLLSWREKSQNEFSEIMNAHSGSITKYIHKLLVLSQAVLGKLNSPQAQSHSRCQTLHVSRVCERIRS